MKPSPYKKRFPRPIKWKYKKAILIIKDSEKKQSEKWDSK